jgi:hypothetical protein
MDVIVDNLKLIIGLVVGGLWLLGKIVEAKKAGQEQQEQPEPWEAEEDYENWEPEPASGGPPPFPPQAAPPPLPMFVTPSEDELERQRLMQEKFAALRREKRSRSAPKMPKKTAAPTTLVSPSLKTRLRNRRELRQAIVMREILDPPVGLR